MNQKINHRFHLVDSSQWPVLTAISALSMLLGAVMYLGYYSNGLLVLELGFLSVLINVSCWWRDVVREGTFDGFHHEKVQKGLRLGMILFIVSEVMFFFGFFWAYFHASLSPAMELGGVWPPVGIHAFDPWGLPFFNTLLLLFSGASITWAHYVIDIGEENVDDFEDILYYGEMDGITGFYFTIFLAVVFTLVQIKEYKEAPFSIADGVYGSSFFMATGFHGFHVIIGTTFIIVMFFRHNRGHFSHEDNHYIGFESAIWYWHFVDVVWLFLFIIIYWWGGLNI